MDFKRIAKALSRRRAAFVKEQGGAVTADWVVLTAGLVLAVWAGILLIRGEAINSVIEVFTWVEQAEL